MKSYLFIITKGNEYSNPVSSEIDVSLTGLSLTLHSGSESEVEERAAQIIRNNLLPRVGGYVLGMYENDLLKDTQTILKFFKVEF